MKHSFLLLFAIPVFSLLTITGCKTATEPAPLTVKQGITGTVTSSLDNSPISGAIVKLSAPAANQTTTNSQGAYRFDNVPVGNYTISFSSAGYGPQSQPVHVDTGANSILNVSLSSASDLAILNFHVQSLSTGLPISGAKVSDNDAKDSAYTDVSGNATLTYSKISGAVRVTITAKNCNSVTKFVTREHGQTTNDTTKLMQFTDNLICDYRFAGNFLDSSGKGHDGTQHGCKFVADRFGNASGALQCNGTTDYVSVPDAADLNFGKTTDFTICVWINFSATQTSQETYIVNKSTTISNVFTGYSASLLSYGYSLDAFAGTTYGETENVADSPAPSDGRWHFVTCVFSRTSGISIYVDGKLDKTVTDSKSYLTGNINTTASLAIGGTGIAKNAYKGMVDDVKIFGVALNDDAILQVYHENGW